MCKKLIFLTSFVLVLALAGTNVAFGDVLEIRVAASEDDAEEHLATGSMDLSSSDLEITEEGSPADNQLIGLRFNNIDVPQGAIITSAYVQFHVDETDVPFDNRPGTKFLRGEAVDNAATFSETAFDISSRPTTSAEAWDWPLWLTEHEEGPDQQTSDIAAVIQELVDRPGWSPGNSLALIITGSGENTAESFDGEADAAPLLHIEYAEPAPPAGANIIWVTSTRDYDVDGVQDDQGFIDRLVAEGHTVDVRIDYWKELDAAKVDELNAADLVIVSRSVVSHEHDDDNEPTLWNSVTTPLILMNGYVALSKRWCWMNTNYIKNANALLMASDTSHPVFDGVTFEGDNMVICLDNTVGTGLSTFLGSIDVGNGTLIAQTSANNTWIAEWPAGAEFYAGSGQIAGGRRMLFVAGTQEEDGPPPTPWGAWNLTAEGEQIFRNAINYMLPAAPIEPPAGANIIWVAITQDYDRDGVQDDQAWIDWLVAEGHTVDVRLDYWLELDLEPGKVDELNAADLVIFSRTTFSGDHDDGDEPTLWNSVTTPIIMMNGYLARTKRWLWMPTDDTKNGDDILLALDTTHPVFDGVTFEAGNMVICRDNTVGSGIATFVASTAVGNGTLIARVLSNNWTWIAEWAAGVEFYAGCGQIAGGPRMLFIAGTQEEDGSTPTPYGAWDLTAEGEKMFRNAINYMLPAAPPAGYLYDGDVALYTSEGPGSLDGTWDHENNSDEWDGTGPGEGNPGGAVALTEDGVTFLRIQDTGDPRDYGMDDPGSNRKVYLIHLIDGGLDGATLEARIRIATSAPLDDQHPDGGGGIEPWPAGGIGYHIRDHGKGMFGIAEAGLGIISFSLAKAGEPDFPDATSDMLVMNNLVGDVPSSDVDTGETAVASNMIAVADVTQWHTFTIDIAAGGAGTHLVSVSVDGGPAEQFEVTTGDDPASGESHITIGSSGTGGITAFDLDYISVQ